MAIIPVERVGEVGIITDRPAHELPFNAWSYGQNVRMRDLAVEKFLGDLTVFGVPSVAPYFLLPVTTPNANFWLYAGLQKVYAWNGAAHTNITRQSAGNDVNYSATADQNWTGSVFGGVAVINNGLDPPQMWNPPDISTKLATLSNWPANTTCKALRAYKTFLVALDIDKNGTRYPFMVKWSHPAPAGAVPVSWDEADATKDAGEHELRRTRGFCIDAVPLRDTMVVYKEDSTYGMQFIGGVSVFRFFEMFDTLGILSRRCAVSVLDNFHAVFGIDDIVVHDGLNINPIIRRMMRKWVYSNIDNVNFRRSFVAHNRPLTEVWFCFPQTGSSLPNTALVWNYRDNTTGVRDLPNTPHVEYGLVDPAVTDGDVWDTQTGKKWDSQSRVWGERQFNAMLNGLLLADATTPRFGKCDTTNQFAGVSPSVFVERTGLGFPFKVGQPPDFSTRKYVTRLWPRIDGTLGGRLNVYIGYQEDINGSVVYQAALPYTIGTTKHIDCRVSGRLHALKFESTSDIDWRLHGYEVEVRPIGRH